MRIHWRGLALRKEREHQGGLEMNGHYQEEGRA